MTEGHLSKRAPVAEDALIVQLQESGTELRKFPEPLLKIPLFRRTQMEVGLSKNVEGHQSGEDCWIATCVSVCGR